LRDEVDAKDETDTVSSCRGFGGYVAGLNTLGAKPEVPGNWEGVTSAKSAKWGDIGDHPLIRGDAELLEITDPWREL
jgi:hypothetical protein